MQETMVAQTVITPQLATAASMLVRLAHPCDQSLHRALARAEERLISQPWRIDAGVLRIVSFSKQNETHRTDGDYCECETKRGTCWHRASWLILSTLAAAGIAPVAMLPLPAALEYDDLPGSFLDGDFESFDDGDLTGYDDYGDVVPSAVVPPPAAWHIQPAVRLIPEPGSDFARAQELADQMFAA